MKDEADPAAKSTDKPSADAPIMHSSFEKRMLDGILMQARVGCYIERHPNLLTEVVLDVDKLFFLSKCSASALADENYRQFRKDLQIAKSLDDAPSRDTLIFRAAYFAQASLYRQLFPRGEPFPSMKVYLRRLATLLDEREERHFRAAAEADGATGEPPAEDANKKPIRKRKQSKSKGI